MITRGISVFEAFPSTSVRRCCWRAKQPYIQHYRFIVKYFIRSSLHLRQASCITMCCKAYPQYSDMVCVYHIFFPLLLRIRLQSCAYFLVLWSGLCPRRTTMASATAECLSAHFTSFLFETVSKHRVLSIKRNLQPCTYVLVNVNLIQRQLLY